MHRRIAQIAILFASMAVLASPSFALDSMDFMSAREKSMGGRHVALADDFSVLLSNPAGLADVPRTFSTADLGVQAIGPVFDIANLVLGQAITTTSVTDFLAANNYKLYAGLDFSGPLALGYTGSGLGFGLFNKTKMIVNVSSASSIGVKVSEAMLLAGGYALKFDLGKGHELAAGVSAKGFVSGELAPTYGIIEAVGLASNPASILGENFTITTGIGMDAGLRWSWEGRYAAGLAFRDAYSPAIATVYKSVQDFVSSSAGGKVGSSLYHTLPSSLDLGLMWSPRLGRLGEVIDSFTLAFDYRDILGFLDPVPRNWILNAGLGMETRVLEILTIRAGITDALPAAGVSFDLAVFKLSLSAFGTELGLDPGDRPCYNLLIDFDFKY
jgi:hypothetical protein